MNRQLGFASALTLVFLSSLAPCASSQGKGPNQVTLAGNVRPEVRPENDRGRVADTLPMQHMLLLLRRSPEREAALQQFMQQQQTPGSANFHHWLTAAEFG